MNKLSVDIALFLQLITFTSHLGIQNDVYALPSINVQSTLYKTLHLKGDSQVYIHHPNQPIKIFVKDKQIIASPYKIDREAARGDDMVKLDDLKKVHHQANYANALLHTIVEQLNHVSTKIDSQKGQIGLGEASPSAQTLADNISKTFFKVDSIPEQNEEAFVNKSKETNASLLKGITDHLKSQKPPSKG